MIPAGCGNLEGTYSNGYCPGFSPDSLFIRGGEPPGTISNYKNTNIFYNNIIYTKKNPQPAMTGKGFTPAGENRVAIRYGMP